MTNQPTLTGTIYILHFVMPDKQITHRAEWTVVQLSLMSSLREILGRDHLCLAFFRGVSITLTARYPGTLADFHRLVNESQLVRRCPLCTPTLREENHE